VRARQYEMSAQARNRLEKSLSRTSDESWSSLGSLFFNVALWWLLASSVIFRTLWRSSMRGYEPIESWEYVI
jgi:hypothetical protein